MQKMLVDILPASVNYLPKKGIKCIACGEPIWGTFEEAAREKHLLLSGSFPDLTLQLVLLFPWPDLLPNTGKPLLPQKSNL